MYNWFPDEDDRDYWYMKTWNLLDYPVLSWPFETQYGIHSVEHLKDYDTYKKRNGNTKRSKKLDTKKPRWVL